jgi:glycosyltransferase involved in cell wall biosynthesis
MKIMLVTDAWLPQVNGVAITWNYIVNLVKRYHEVLVVHPNIDGAKHIFTLYHDIPMVKNPFHVISRYFDKFKPDKIHITTEGLLGLAMRKYCVMNGINFTTSHHTRLADYGWVLYRIPKFVGQLYIKWFHKPSRKVLVPTKSIANLLGFSNCVVWGRGVDTTLFNCYGDKRPSGSPKTIIYVGRVSRDKNLDEFCKISGYRKILVGDGPYLKELKSKYSDVLFVGFVPHNELRYWYGKADVFVFPSKLDTFGLVMLEAMSCGLPVVAYNVSSPKDIVKDRVTGFLGDNLEENIAKAFDNLDYLSKNAIEYAESQSWQSISEEFIRHLDE